MFKSSDQSSCGWQRRLMLCAREGFKALTLVVYLLLASALTFASASAQTWDGGGADNNWSTAANWSGDAVPTGTAAVTFNNTSTKNVTIDSVGSWSGGSLTIASTYTGTVTQSVSMSLSSFSQAAGTYSAANLNITGAYTRTGGTFIENTSTTTFNGTSGSSTITDGGTNFYNLVVNGSGGTWSFADSVTVTNNLTVTAGTLRTARDVVGDVTVTGTLLVNTSGIFIIRRSSTAGDGAGQTITAGTLTIAGSMHGDAEGFSTTLVASSSLTAGGSHGGYGLWRPAATAQATYGSFTNPTSLGRGGLDTGLNALGGGAIVISSTGTVTVNGTLSVNGAASGFIGGAGGSINITAGTLTGTGAIRANGAFNNNKTSGGGGRISLNGVTTDNFTGTLQANGGGTTGAWDGFAGTIYLNSAKRTSLTLGGAGNLSSLTLGSDGTNNYTFGTITIQSGGTLTIGGNPAMNSGNGGAATLNVTTLTVDSDGTLSANAQGFWAYKTASATNYGGSYGGVGLWTSGASAAATYGSFDNPINIGMGGNHDATYGGAGGGALMINASGTFTVNGTVSANGGTAVLGGGAGGSVNIVASDLTGSGTISANGGSAQSTPGGGGRIGLNGVVTDSFSGTIQVSGGAWSNRAPRAYAGTVYLNSTRRNALTIGGSGNLSSVTLGTDGTNNYTFGSITVQSGGALTLGGNPTLNSGLGGAATINLTNLTVNSGGTVSADDMGMWGVLTGTGTNGGKWQ